MEIKLGWAVVTGLAVGGAIGWWQLGHPGWQTLDQKVAAAEKTAAADKNGRNGGEPALYRWRDRDGVLQVTDKPPKGRKYEKVKIRADQNIIPMSELANPPANQAPKKPGAG